MKASIDRLHAEIGELARFSSAPAPAVTRVLFSPEDLAAREFLTEKARAAGLKVRSDAVGNLFLRWEGSDPSAPAVATGSHIDAIPNAGRFDGVVGVLGAIEAVRSLQESGFQPVKPIEIIVFTAEEPTRFGLGCLGSRLLGGALAPDTALQLRDPEGKSLAQWLEEMPWGSPDLGSVALAPGTYSAFVELHIEQGPLLENEGINIGIVEKIAAPAALRIELEGEGGHAGAVLMPGRRDAGLGAAEIALAVERSVLDLGSPDGVGTTGVVHLFPGAINSIPCRAVLEIDIRDTDHTARKAVEEEVARCAAEIVARRRLAMNWQVINSDPPAVCAPSLVELASALCAQLGCSAKRMPSRAYHDSLFMALIAPTTMIFIPCHRGYSHRPDEFASTADIERGVNVLARMLAHLSSPPNQ